MNERDILLLELQKKVSDYELEIKTLKARLHAQTNLLQQMQQFTLEESKTPRKLSELTKKKWSYYNEMKDKPEVIDKLQSLVPDNKRVPWQWIKNETDRMFSQNLQGKNKI